MSSPPPRQNSKFDYYCAFSVASTTDEHGVYVTKESAEVIELGWILVDAKTLQTVAQDSVLIKPVNTPITPLCTSLTTLTWEHVRNAGDFKDAIKKFDQFYHRHIARDGGGSNNGSSGSGGKSPSWAFVTLDAWDLRVQIPREARDKSCVLPMYLQHSVTFELRQEYQRWQAYHPESLPFGSSSLQNICAALEVEAVQSSAPIKHNLPFHLQALAPAAPRRAVEEAETLARVLRNLIRKSQPAEAHPDILRTPLDSSSDVRAFMGEKSKVLYMAGLPHDTTQSELESWFTQFGGRPIAFWTLRTSDQNKPTGTGFAVFSSHEEAAESLCMNGRALNEKAIEIAPSSGRVLDRAQDMLVPFPPSKNRPRPGDWTCPSCGFSNFQRRTACFRCQFSAIGHGPDQMGYGYGYGHPGMMGGGGGGGGGPHYGGHGGHGMGHHGGGGGGGGGGRHGGSIIPFRPGDWKCGADGCAYHNFAKNVSCLRCGASRSTAAVPPEPSFSQGGGGPGPMVDSHGHGHGHSHAHHAMYSSSSMASTPGPYGGGPGPSGYGPGGGGGFHGQQYGGPASTYALPSGLGAAASAYPPMGSHYSPGAGAHHAPGFDHRAAEAFSSAGATPSGGGNGAYGYDGAGNGNNGNGNGGGGVSNGGGNGQDPFAFLATGLGGLSVNDDGRRNGTNTGAASAKSPS